MTCHFAIHILQAGTILAGTRKRHGPLRFLLGPGLAPQFKRACLAYDVLDNSAILVIIIAL